MTRGQFPASSKKPSYAIHLTFIEINQTGHISRQLMHSQSCELPKKRSLIVIALLKTTIDVLLSLYKKCIKNPITILTSTTC